MIGCFRADLAAFCLTFRGLRITLYCETLEIQMEGFFAPLHLVILLFSAAMVFGMPFLAGFFLGRYVEAKRAKRA